MSWWSLHVTLGVFTLDLIVSSISIRPPEMPWSSVGSWTEVTPEETQVGGNGDEFLVQMNDSLLLHNHEKTVCHFCIKTYIPIPAVFLEPRNALCVPIPSEICRMRDTLSTSFYFSTLQRFWGRKKKKVDGATGGKQRVFHAAN
jgi:hypothetical protein